MSVQPAGPAAFNVPITFGRSGTAAGMGCSGIDFGDPGERSWTTAPLVEIEIRLPPAREDVTLEINTGAFSIDSVPRQHVFGYLGGMFIGFWIVKDFGRITALVPRALLAGRVTRLAFALPNAISPMALGLSEDRRELGLHLHSIIFKPGQ